MTKAKQKVVKPVEEPKKPEGEKLISFEVKRAFNFKGKEYKKGDRVELGNEIAIKAMKDKQRI